MEEAKQSLFWGRAIDQLGEFTRTFTAIVIGFILLLAVVQVVLRYCTTLPLFGIEELVTFPMLWMFFMGGACTSYDKTHISCGILEVITANELLISLKDVMVDIVECAIGLLIVSWAYGYVRYSVSVGKVSMHYGIPMAVAESGLLVGFVFITGFTFVKLYDDIKAFKQVRKVGEKGDQGHECNATISS